MRKTQITIDVELDENHIPENITWNAQDGGIEKEATKATMISVWDDKTMEALRIDLWTKVDRLGPPIGSFLGIIQIIPP